MFFFQLCAAKISLTCRSLRDCHKGNVYIVPTAFSFWIFPGPIFGNLPNLTCAFIPKITSLHTFTSSTIAVEGKCQFLHPAKKCMSIKSCKYWELAGIEGLCQGRQMRNNSCSKPEFQSASYCHSWFHCSFAAPTGSEPLGTKEKIFNLVTRFPKWQNVTSLGTRAASCMCPPSVLGCRLVPLSFVTGGHKPLEKSFNFKVGKFSFLLQVHLFQCYFLIAPPCLCGTVQLICLPAKCSWLLELLRWIAQLMQTGCVFILCCATLTATRGITELKCGS